MNLESREFEKNNDPPTVGLSVDEKASTPFKVGESNHKITK
jgi:hypothetical protein